MQETIHSEAALEQRLQQVERSLTKQRRITAALAAFALVGCLAASQSAEPEVLRAHRFEVVDPQGHVVAAFGLGAAPLNDSKGRESLGWYLRDPESEAAAGVYIGESSVWTDQGLDEHVPVVLLALQGGNGYLQASASEFVTSVELFHGEDLSRSASLSVQSDRTALTFESPPIGGEDAKPQNVLKVQHSSGKPTIQGWDEQGNVAIDIK
jgi:hypothetical protein